MTDLYTPSDAECKQGPSYGSNYRGTATQKPLTIISLGNEQYHPSQQDMDRFQDQLVDMGAQDFLVVPYQVEVHQIYMPMVEEKETVEAKQMKATAPSKKTSVGHEIEQIQENLYKCREQLVAAEGSLHYTGCDTISHKLLELKEALKPIENAEARAMQKYFVQLGEPPQADMKMVKDIASVVNANNVENESNTPDFILGQFAADAIAAANKAIKHRDQWRSGERQADIAGALFDFVGYLTTLKAPTTVGSNYCASNMLNHLTAWSKERGLNLDEANIWGWNRTGSAEKAEDVQLTQKSKVLHSRGGTINIGLAEQMLDSPIGCSESDRGENKVEREESSKTEAASKIKDEVISLMRESLTNFIGSPTITKTGELIHISANAHSSIPLEYINIAVKLEENNNVL